jgi:4-amino-4-deoxy-L-arabinose transferase-like glycosyltransferase
MTAIPFWTRIFRGIEQEGITAKAGIVFGFEQAANRRTERALRACLASDAFFVVTLAAGTTPFLPPLLCGRGPNWRSWQPQNVGPVSLVMYLNWGVSVLLAFF